MTIEETHTSAIERGIPVIEAIEKTLGSVENPEIEVNLMKSENSVVVIEKVIHLTAVTIKIDAGEAIVAKIIENIEILLSSSLDRSIAVKLLKFLTLVSSFKSKIQKHTHAKKA